MKVLQRFHSLEGEYFQYRRPAKLISEILIVLSSIVAVASIGTLIGLGLELDSSEDTLVNGRSSKDISLAFFIYTIVILIVCISDIVFAVILYCGIEKLKLSYCLFWRGATITSLIVTGMITLSFITMIHDLVVVLGYIPSVISKPFCLWVVNGFVLELGELRTLPCNVVGGAAHPPAKPTFSLGDLESIKRSTTIFNMHKGRKGEAQFIVTAKLKSIPE